MKFQYTSIEKSHQEEALSGVMKTLTSTLD